MVADPAPTLFALCVRLAAARCARRCPDTSQIKKKMVYAASKDTLRKKFVGLGAEVQGTSLDEVDYETILDKVAKGPGNQ